MDIPTIHFTQAQFDALRILPTGTYNQPEGRYLSSTGQWLYIAPGKCAVIEIAKPQRLALEKLARYPSKRDAIHGRKVKIFSKQWGSYWRPGGAGYTPDARDAGVFTAGDAWERTRHCGREKGIEFEILPAT